MRTASNSPLTQKYGDKTTHVSITVLFVIKLIGSPVLTQLRTGPKKCRFSIPIGKNRAPRGPPWTTVPKHATAYIYNKHRISCNCGRFIQLYSKFDFSKLYLQLFFAVFCYLINSVFDGVVRKWVGFNLFSCLRGTQSLHYFNAGRFD